MALPILPTLNGTRVISARLVFPWRGVWMAELELDPELIATVLTKGPATLVLAGVTLTGVLDARASGTFGSKATVRMVGGRGGWDTVLKPQHFSNPGGGLLSTLVYTATGGIVGELVADPIPKVFGQHFVRSGGAASRVFEDNDWHVDPVTGTTFVAPWLPLPLDPTATILDFNPYEQRATIASDTFIFPGMLLVDPRFNGKVPIARDVEQVFDSSGSRAEVWCATKPVARLADAFTVAVREAAGTAYLKTYKYRFILPAGQKLALQSVTGDAPDLNPIDQWSGLSGAQAKLTPGTEIVVGFIGGDPKQPFLVSFSPLATPLEVDLAGGANYLVPAPWATALAAALTTFTTGLTPGTLVTNAAALATAVNLLTPLSSTILTKAT